jgi:hypothetical protein
MVSKIYNRINGYTGFDLNEIYNCGGIVFGGAVRDSIADMAIHDIDIMCFGKHQHESLGIILNENGYFSHKKLANRDLQSMYKGLHVIYEPITYIKEDRSIQLIRPSNEVYDVISKNNILGSVDMTCCAVSFDGNNLYENYPGAIDSCLIKLVELINTNSMYDPISSHMRREKLLRRGWHDSMTNSLKRQLKLNELLNIDKITYIKQYPETNHKDYTTRGYRDMPF